SRRGQAEFPARIAGILSGHPFVPFHFGYWDAPQRARAANELTSYEWDPVSKQPHFKYAAVKLEPVSEPTIGQPETTGRAVTSGMLEAAVETVESTATKAVKAIKRGGRARNPLRDYIGLLR